MTDVTMMQLAPQAPASTDGAVASRWLLALLTLFAMLPALVPLQVILRDGVDVPYADQYEAELQDVSLAAAHGHLSPLLFRQHNEHRVLMPKLIYILLDPLSHGNVRWQMLAEWVVVLATSATVLGLLTRTTGLWPRQPVRLLLLWFACNVLIFSPVQLENWLWGIGLMNVMPMAFIAGMLLALERPPSHPRLAAAVLLASAATFSSGNGLLAWPLGFVMLLAPGEPASVHRRTTLLVWSGAVLVNAVLFVHGYQRSAMQTAGYHAGAVTMLVYLLAFLGSPFAFLVGHAVVGCAVVFGLVLLGGAGWMFLQWREHRTMPPTITRPLIVWGCVGGFALLSGIMAAPTRAALGLDQAITPRYTSFAIYLPIGLLGGAGVLLGIDRQRRLPAYGAIALTVLSLAGYPDAIDRANIVRVIRLQAKGALLMVNVLPRNPQLSTLLHPDPVFLRKQANILNAAGWLRPPLVRSADVRTIQNPAPPPPDDVGRLEQFVSIDAKSDGVAGWALFPGKHLPADAVIVSVERSDGKDIAVAMGQIRLARPDIATRFGPDCLVTGWNASVSRAVLAALAKTHPGPLRLHAWSLDVETGRAARMAGAAEIGPAALRLK